MLRKFPGRFALLLTLSLVYLFNIDSASVVPSWAQGRAGQPATLFLPAVANPAAGTPTASKTPTPTPTSTPTATVNVPAANQPANPAATLAARQVLAWLQRPDQGCQIVAGQDIGTLDTASENYANLVEALHTSSGRYVGLLGADYMSWDGATDRHNTNQLLINHWNNGGLVELSWHAPNPWTGGGCLGRKPG